MTRGQALQMARWRKYTRHRFAHVDKGAAAARTQADGGGAALQGRWSQPIAGIRVDIALPARV